MSASLQVSGSAFSPSHQAIGNSSMPRAGCASWCSTNSIPTAPSSCGCRHACALGADCVPRRCAAVRGHLCHAGWRYQLAEQQREMATVASRLFGIRVMPERTIGETLRRVTAMHRANDLAFVAWLTASLGDRDSANWHFPRAMRGSPQTCLALGLSIPRSARASPRIRALAPGHIRHLRETGRAHSPSSSRCGEMSPWNVTLHLPVRSRGTRRLARPRRARSGARPLAH